MQGVWSGEGVVGQLVSCHPAGGFCAPEQQGTGPGSRVDVCLLVV